MTYSCSPRSNVKNGIVEAVLPSDGGLNRLYQVKYSNGKVTEISGLLVWSDALDSYVQDVCKKSQTNKGIDKNACIGVLAHQAFDDSKNSSKEIALLAFTAALQSQNGLGFGGVSPGNAGGAMGGVTGAMIRDVNDPLGPYAPRSYVERRKGALIVSRGAGTVHSSEQSVGRENPYVETRPAVLELERRSNAAATGSEMSEHYRTANGDSASDQNESAKKTLDPFAPPVMPKDTRPGVNLDPPAGALIKSRGANLTVSTGQIIGRDRVTTFRGELNPFEELSKLSYREGQDHQISLPSGNQKKDLEDSNLIAIKADIEKLKQTVRCCISGSNRECESKNTVSFENLLKEMKLSMENASNSGASVGTSLPLNDVNKTQKSPASSR